MTDRSTRVGGGPGDGLPPGAGCTRYSPCRGWGPRWSAVWPCLPVFPKPVARAFVDAFRHVRQQFFGDAEEGSDASIAQLVADVAALPLCRHQPAVPEAPK